MRAYRFFISLFFYVCLVIFGARLLLKLDHLSFVLLIVVVTVLSSVLGGAFVLINKLIKKL